LRTLDTGKSVTTYPIGEHVDASAFDPETKLVFNSFGEGSIAVFHQDSADNYTALASIQTVQGSKTMALDTGTHRLYVPSMPARQFTILVLDREANEFAALTKTLQRFERPQDQEAPAFICFVIFDGPNARHDLPLYFSLLCLNDFSTQFDKIAI
jgi:hypothetical protein